MLGDVWQLIMVASSCLPGSSSILILFSVSKSSIGMELVEPVPLASFGSASTFQSFPYFEAVSCWVDYDSEELVYLLISVFLLERHHRPEYDFLGALYVIGLLIVCKL